MPPTNTYQHGCFMQLATSQPWHCTHFNGLFDPRQQASTTWYAGLCRLFVGESYPQGTGTGSLRVESSGLERGGPLWRFGAELTLARVRSLSARSRALDLASDVRVPDTPWACSRSRMSPTQSLVSANRITNMFKTYQQRILYIILIKC
jgi:hypothetical protein